MLERECLFAIPSMIIKWLLTLGIFKYLCSKETTAPKKKHVNPVNQYFRMHKTNIVWMHVQDGYGIFINEHVTTKDGKKVNIVDSLSKYYWYIDNYSGLVKSATPKEKIIYRYIGSIIECDDIDEKMPEQLEVHHKWWKWCNTQNTMVNVSHKQHNDFHNGIGTHKSHKMGVIISAANQMQTRLEEIQQMDDKYSKEDM